MDKRRSPAAADKRLSDRIEGRKAAELFIDEYVDGESEDWMVGFARACLAFAEGKLSVPVNTKPMTEEESRRFETTRFKYGKHRDELIGGVPMEYLNWIADEHRPLIRYVDGQRAMTRTERGD